MPTTTATLTHSELKDLCTGIRVLIDNFSISPDDLFDREILGNWAEEHGFTHRNSDDFAEQAEAWARENGWKEPK